MTLESFFLMGAKPLVEDPHLEAAPTHRLGGPQSQTQRVVPPGREPWRWTRALRPAVYVQAHAAGPVQAQMCWAALGMNLLKATSQAAKAANTDARRHRCAHLSPKRGENPPKAGKMGKISREITQKQGELTAKAGNRALHVQLCNGLQTFPTLRQCANETRSTVLLSDAVSINQLLFH